MSTVTPARTTAQEALLDAAERILLTAGGTAVTTRRLAEEAGVNHGLVHYYFGSVDNVMLRVLERFTTRMIGRQRAMYASEEPFRVKWGTAMRYLTADDLAYQKVWLELQALAWNRPDLRARLQLVHAEWRAVLTEALAEPHARLGLPMPLAVLVSLVMTFNEGIMLDQLSGVTEGHREFLDWIDRWLLQ